MFSQAFALREMCFRHLADCSGLSTLWLPGELSRSKGDQMSSLVPSGRDLSSCRLVFQPRVHHCPLNSATFPHTSGPLSHKTSFSYPKMTVPPVICWDADSVSKFYTLTKQLLCTKH